MILTYTWLVVAITALVFYLLQIYSKFSRNGVNHLPVVPFFGNFLWVFLKKEHAIDCLERTMNTFPNDRIIGHYSLMSPVYLVRDLEALKRITITDFEHFVDRRQVTDKLDPLFGRGLVMLHGEEWKAMRSTMGPVFSSAKIRLMVPFMEEVGKEMNKVIKEKIKESGKPFTDVETKDMMQRFATDAIASCAFGLKVNSQRVDDEFYLKSKEITTNSFGRVMRELFYRCLPIVAQMMNVSLVRRETTEYFTNVVLCAMKDREKNNIVRNDMINILVEVKRGQLTHEKESEDTDAGFATVEESYIGKKQHSYEWSDTDLVAQAALFLLEGLETSSTSMSFLLYQLAVNPDVQNRLLEEIREHDVKNGGKIDYNSIHSMTYLDMVVSDSRRRRFITPWAYHRNPKYFPDPTTFDPDRFSPENRDKIIPFTYMPFGIGPRNCIGSRFALCEMKVMAYLLIREMELYPCEQTCFPPELAKEGFNMELRGGAWVRIRVRPQ